MTLKPHNYSMISFSEKWLPILVCLVFAYLFPPISLAIIIAFISSPLLNALMQVTRLPASICTLLVMGSLGLFLTAILWMLLHSLTMLIPILEEQLSALTSSEAQLDQWIKFVEEKLVAFAYTLIEHVVTITQLLFQQLMNFVIFLIAYFFALKESSKNRFWFLIYFPKKVRGHAKRGLRRAGDLIVTFLSIEVRLICITFIILLLGFTLLKFQLALGMAFVISLVDSLPFLGIGVFLIPMIGYFIYQGNIGIGCALIGLYFFTIIIRHFAETKLWSAAFHLRPIHAFFLLACAVYAFGVIGILLTPFCLFIVNKVKQHQFFTE